MTLPFHQQVEHQKQNTIEWWGKKYSNIFGSFTEPFIYKCHVTDTVEFQVVGAEKRNAHLAKATLKMSRTARLLLTSVWFAHSCDVLSWDMTASKWCHLPPHDAEKIDQSRKNSPSLAASLASGDDIMFDDRVSVTRFWWPLPSMRDTEPDGTAAAACRCQHKNHTNINIPVMWSETVGLWTRPVWDQNIGLGLAGLVLCCERRSCHARRHTDLEGHSNFSCTIYSFSMLCLEHHYCGDQQ